MGRKGDDWVGGTNFASQGHLALPGDMSAWHSWGEVLLAPSVKESGVTEHPTIPGQPVSLQQRPSPNAHSTKAETFRMRVQFRGI